MGDFWNLTGLPALNEWVLIWSRKTFYKARRLGKETCWYWRTDKGGRVVGIKPWAVVPEFYEGERDGKDVPESKTSVENVRPV